MNKKELNTRLGKTVCISDEIDDFMKYLGMDSRMQELKILNVWTECVGENISKFSTPVKIEKNKLFISVETAVWRYELNVRKPVILEKVNSILKNKNIKDIVFI